MSTKRNVSAAIVRDFLNSPEGQAALKEAGVATKVGTRGRHNPAQVAVFHKANPRLRYEVASEAEAPSLTVPVTGLDKAGRKTTRQVSLTTAEARAALGQPTSRKGRISRDTLSLALSAVEADKVADQFTADPA